MYVPSNEARLNIGNITMIALIVKTFTDFLTSLQKAQQARADYWILTNMSDKELHDIGIARGEIRNVVAESFK
jgi:uncharacterized protein YjiS (DUF1127 family)